MLRGKLDGGRVGVRDARVGDQTHAGLRAALTTLRCWATRAPTSLPETKRSLSAPAKAARQRRRVVVVGRADATPRSARSPSRSGCAAGGDDLLGRDAAVEQGLDGEAAEMSGGPVMTNDMVFLSVGRCSHPSQPPSPANFPMESTHFEVRY